MIVKGFGEEYIGDTFQSLRAHIRPLVANRLRRGTAAKVGPNSRTLAINKPFIRG